MKNRMPKVMLNFRPSGRRKLGRPIRRDWDRSIKAEILTDDDDDDDDDVC